MTVFPALIAPDKKANPPLVIYLYASPDIRDQLFAQNRNLPGIGSADLRLSELSDAELSQTVLMVAEKDPEFPALLQAYLEEKAGRLCTRIEADVEGALAGNKPVVAEDMIWEARFLIAKAAFEVGLDGNGQLAATVFALGEFNEAQLRRVIERANALIVRKTLPILMRLVPRPPFIAAEDYGR